MQTGPDDMREPVLREALESPRLHGEGKAGLGLRDQTASWSATSLRVLPYTARRTRVPLGLKT
jgi:hypothetical protein